MLLKVTIFLIIQGNKDAFENGGFSAVPAHQSILKECLKMHTNEIELGEGIKMRSGAPMIFQLRKRKRPIQEKSIRLYFYYMAKAAMKRICLIWSMDWKNIFSFSALEVTSRSLLVLHFLLFRCMAGRNGRDLIKGFAC